MKQDVKVMQLFVDQMVGIPKFSYPARVNNAPKPADVFAHIRLLEEYQIGIPNARIKAQNATTTTYISHSPAKLRFRIGVVDTDGVPSSKIMHGWTSEAIKQLMISTGYGFISCHPISNEDAKLEQEWEIRNGFSVEMYVTRVFEEVVDNITSLVVSGAYTTDTLDTVLLNFNINNITN